MPIDLSRFGIRARLLSLLLPAIMALLALDSWNDHRTLRDLGWAAHDQSMLASVNVLRASISIAPDGALRLDAPKVVQTVFEAAERQHQHVRVGLTQLSDARAQTPGPTLLGEPDLPLPSGPMASGSPVWYDGRYHDAPVRMVALRSEIVDERGERFDLLIQLAEESLLRNQGQADAVQQALWRDARMVLVVVLLVWLGVTWSLRPLEALRKSVLARKGRSPAPLDASDVPHEVAPLVDAVNEHVESYRDLLDRQSQFLADASHQLRTPLAIMLTQAGVALRETATDRLHETLRAMVGQISRSSRLCEQLLSLAHASDSTSASKIEVVDLNSITRDVVLQYLGLAHEKDHDLGWAGTDAGSVPVRANAAELHEALANLLHNAIAYTPAGGRITVTSGVQDGQAFAEVRDNGPGIAPDLRARVFERFRQGEVHPGKGVQGAGLGLAIGRAYARRNGGDIELADADANDPHVAGLRAVLRLPLERNDLPAQGQ